MISVTALSSYQYCARKLFLERVLKLVTEDKPALIRGSLYHACLEELNKAEEELIRKISLSHDYPSVVSLFTEFARGIVGTQTTLWRGKVDAVGLDFHKLLPELSFVIQTEARNRARDVFSFSELNGNVRGDELWKLWDPKKSSEQKITLEDLGIRGIIDCILKFEDGSLIPIEYKTGKSPRGGVWPGHKIQVAAYGIMLEKTFGTPVHYGIIRYLDNARDEKVHINPMLRDEVLSLIPVVNGMLERPELPERCSSQAKCKSCDYAKYCYDDAFMAERLRLALEAREKGEKLPGFVV